jgi:hypothetical protein
LIGAARIVRACRVRHVQEVIFHSCEADIAKRVAMAMLAPSAAARSAMARPMPRLAPVMNRVLPLVSAL